MRYRAMYLMGKLRNKFVNQEPENDNHYIKSRNAFIFDSAVVSAVVTLVAGTYLSGLLELIGASKVLNGLINALPLLASLSSPFGAIFVQRYSKQKPFVYIGAILYRVMFVMLLFLPFIPLNKPLKIFAAAFLLCLGYFISGFIASSSDSWIFSLVPIKIRGKFFATKTLSALIAIAAITLLAGGILDFFGAKGDKRIGFLILGIIAGLLTLISLLALSKVMEPKTAEERGYCIKPWEAFKMALGNLNFRTYIIMDSVFSFGNQILTPYIGIYLIHDLKLSYTAISIITLACIILQGGIVKWWGRLADKTSWIYVSRLAILIISISRIAFLFLVPSNAAWLYSGIALFASLGAVATGISTINIQYDYAPEKGRILYMGIGNATVTVLGFAGALFGSGIMLLTQRLKPRFFGINISPQQVMGLFSGITMLMCTVYIKKAMENK